MTEFKIKHHGNSNYSVYNKNSQLLCAFQGPMAASAAATFTKALEKNKNASPMDIEKYLEKEI